MASARARRRRLQGIAEFLWFGWQQALACAFAGAFLGLLAWSQTWPRDLPLPRYDLLLIGAIALQAAMLALRLETWRELRVIAVFHVLGVVLEVFKTHPGIASWSYPEFGYAKVLGVPLYSGFMYAAVASYMLQSWHLLDLRLHHEPPTWLASLIALAIYANFFTHHALPDLRWWLAAALAWVYRDCTVSYQPRRFRLRMPLVISFVLIGFFVWLAENVATYFGAWTYPHQADGWRVVHAGKIGSWGLLVVLSFVLVSTFQRRASASARSARADGTTTKTRVVAARSP